MEKERKQKSMTAKEEAERSRQEKEGLRHMAVWVESDLQAQPCKVSATALNQS